MELRVAVIRILGMDLGHPKNNGFFEETQKQIWVSSKTCLF
jgi:hypothetical protein